MRLVLLAIAVLAGACSAPPIACRDDDTCPPGLSCVDGTCGQRSEGGAGAEGGEGEGEGEIGGGAEGEGEGGAAACGDTASGLFTARSIAVGFDTSCAVTCDERVVCWGEYAEDAPLVDDVAFARVAVGQSFVCAVDAASGAVSCRGRDVVDDTPAFPIAHASAGQAMMCGLDAAGASVCWGALRVPFDDVGGPLDELAVGFEYVCGTKRIDGTVVCGGETSFHPRVPAGTALTHIGVGSYFACGLDAAGAVRCFDGDGVDDDAGAPAAAGFVDLAVGDGVACAIDAAGLLACFAENTSSADVLTAVPAFPVRSVAVGTDHACAIRAADDAVVCWGDDAFGRTDVPPG